MSRLMEHIKNLFEFIEKDQGIPKYATIKVIDQSNIQYAERPTIKSADLIDVKNFDDRFEKLLAAGYAWINIACYGLLDEDMVVCIEHPREEQIVPEGKTVIRYSGPPMDHKTKAAIWDISKFYTVGNG